MKERTNRERLYWLIELLTTNKIELDNFCNEFHITYDHHTHSNELSVEENKFFGEIAYEAARFSEHEEDHTNYPFVYSTSAEVLEKVQNATRLLNINK